MTVTKQQAGLTDLGDKVNGNGKVLYTAGHLYPFTHTFIHRYVLISTALGPWRGWGYFYCLKLCLFRLSLINNSQCKITVMILLHTTGPEAHSLKFAIVL